MIKNFHVVIISILVMMISGIIVAFPDGQNITGSTGAPGETSCSCHGNLNKGTGVAEIITQGDYAPNDTLNLTAKMKNIDQLRWGFAVTALDASNLPVGELIATDGIRTMKTISFNDRQYIKHTNPGTDGGVLDSTMWNFQWVAPAIDAGLVTFYMAGLASNGDNFVSGDSVYTTTYSLMSTAIDSDYWSVLPQEFVLTRNYPNPFNPSTVIEFSLPRKSDVKLEILDITGRKIETIWEADLGVGIHRFTWDAGNYPSGFYFYRLHAVGSQYSGKMTLIK